MPDRLQLSRAKGWRKPAGAILVTRPGPWGNPFITGRHGDALRCVTSYRNLMVHRAFDFTQPPCPSFAAQAFAYDHMRASINTLRGHDLACWCRLDAPCHADVLLEIANG